MKSSLPDERYTGSC